MEWIVRHRAGWLLITLFFVLGCGLPVSVVQPGPQGTAVAETVAALGRLVAETGTAAAAQVAAPMPADTPTATSAPEPTATPRNPTVKKLALCWTGPGQAYPVVSSIQAGTEVKLLGIGSVPNWYVIENPRYHDRCWIEAASLELDAQLNLLTLEVFNPPPTPGPTETPIPEPTT